jgi:hypothetical protein
MDAKAKELINVKTKELMELIMAKLKARGVDNEAAARECESIAKQTNVEPEK